MHQFVRMPNGSLYIVSNAPNSVHDEAYPSPKGHTLSNNIGASDLLEEANAAPEPSQARKFLYTNSSCATGMRQPLKSNISEEVLVRKPKRKHKKNSTYLE